MLMPTTMSCVTLLVATVSPETADTTAEAGHAAGQEKERTGAALGAWPQPHPGHARTLWTPLSPARRLCLLPAPPARARAPDTAGVSTPSPSTRLVAEMETTSSVR